jgi:hypothetical protein
MRDLTAQRPRCILVEKYAPSASATIAPVRKLVLPTATIAFHAARFGGSRFANAAVVKSLCRLPAE